MVIEMFVSGALGAFVAAWAGAYVGFRRGKKERALDRRLGWHEQAIQGLAEYEECLERLRGNALNALVIKRELSQSSPGATEGAADLPRLIRAPASLWRALAVAEQKARAALRLADLYTEGRTKIDCSVALTTSVNMVSGQWTDIGPDPQIRWLDLQSKAMAAANLRRKLQESLAVVLELGGFIASILGTKYRQRRALREIERLRAEIEKGAS